MQLLHSPSGQFRCWRAVHHVNASGTTGQGVFSLEKTQDVQPHAKNPACDLVVDKRCSRQGSTRVWGYREVERSNSVSSSSIPWGLKNPRVRALPCIGDPCAAEGLDVQQAADCSSGPMVLLHPPRTVRAGSSRMGYFVLSAAMASVGQRPHNVQESKGHDSLLSLRDSSRS